MLPGQTVEASCDLNALVLCPSHWSKFDVSVRPWDEPIIRVTAEAKRRDVTVATPFMGEVFDLEKLPQAPWREALRTESDRLAINDNSKKVLRD